MANKEISTTDEELQALMAELEEQNVEIMAATEAAKPVVVAVVVPEPEPEPVAVAVAEPEPVLVAKPAPTAPAVAEPEPQPEPKQEEVEHEEVTESADVPKVRGAVKKASPLDYYVDATKFNEDTRVSEVNLDQCMIEQNSLRAYYGVMAANAEAQANRIKARFEVIEATLYEFHRKAFASAGEKATVQMVDSAVKVDPRWLKGKNVLIEAESVAMVNKALVESLKDRRDMIIQLGADRRDEFKGSARILAEKNERDDLKARALQSGRREAA